MKDVILFNTNTYLGELPEEWFVFDEAYAASGSESENFHLIYRLKKTSTKKLINYLILSDRVTEAQLIRSFLFGLSYRDCKFVFDKPITLKLNNRIVARSRLLYLIERETLKVTPIFVAEYMIKEFGSSLVIGFRKEIIKTYLIKCPKEILNFYKLKTNKYYLITDNHAFTTNPVDIPYDSFQQLTVI